MSPEAWEGAKIAAGLVVFFGGWWWVVRVWYPNRRCGTCRGTKRLYSASSPNRWRDCPKCGGKGDFIRGQS